MLKLKYDDDSDLEDDTPSVPLGIVEDKNGDRTFYIKEFDLNKMTPIDANDIKHGTRILAIGRPGVGKSKIIESIMLYKEHVTAAGLFISGSEKNNGEFANIVPPIFVHSDLDMKFYEKTINRQPIAKKYLKNSWVFHVINDVASIDPTVLKKKPFSEIYFNGRHLNIIHVLSAQYMMDFKKSFRSSIDYIFLCKETNAANLTSLYENFGKTYFKTEADFVEIMAQVTEDFTALVIVNNGTSNKIEDCLFWYRADLSKFPPGWKFGSETMWAHDAQRRDPNYVDPLY